MAVVWNTPETMAAPGFDMMPWMHQTHYMHPLESSGWGYTLQSLSDYQGLHNLQHQPNASSDFVVSNSAKRRHRRHKMRCGRLLVDKAENELAPAARCAVAVAEVAEDPDVPGSTGHPEIEHLKEQLDLGADEQKVALERMRGHIWRLSTDKEGCRVVQTAFQQAGKQVTQELVAELHGHVLEAMQCPHANFVVQKVLEVMPPANAIFVARELKEHVTQVARHRFGCRILCRLLEHCTAENETLELVTELLAQVVPLCRHAFGHFVMQSLVEHGLPAHRMQIASDICIEDVKSIATNRNASHVIEKMMMHVGSEEKRLLVQSFLGDASFLVPMAKNQYGYIALRALLQFPSEEAQAALSEIKQFIEELNGNKYGRRLLEELKLSAGNCSL